MSTIAVMQLVDTLEAGGAEQLAVNLANYLPRDLYRSFLCASRRAGPLAGRLAGDIACLQLARRGRFDWRAFQRLVAFVRARRIDLLHAHGPSLFLACAVSLAVPQTRVLWHLHYGRFALQDRRCYHYRLAARLVGGVITVNDALADWCRRRLKLPSDRVWYVPNFVTPPAAALPQPRLPGEPSRRVVCVANLRPEKDHPTLLRAMESVVRRLPSAHLLLVGARQDDASHAALLREIGARRLHRHVTWLGPRDDVPAILRASAVAVLASRTEGLPMALLEYGSASLPVVATDVGQCREVLDQGRAGVLVPPGQPARLADALVALLENPARRASLGRALHAYVEARHTPAAVLSRIGRAYATVLADRGPSAWPG